MYGTHIRRIPRTQSELWKILEEHLSFITHVFEDYPVETRGDAVRETFRPRPGSPKRSSKRRIRSDHGVMLAIKHRGVSSDYDNREEFVALGRRLIEPIRQS